MSSYKNLLIPILLLTISLLIAIYFRPILIIDETRYVSVAWEMFDKKEFLVPHLNGLPYDHKPPLLFWLINLDWFLFGINETSIRFIPLLFAIGILILGYKIYKLLWPNDSYGAEIFPWVLVGGVAFSFYSTLLMFDIMLGFWVALAIYGGVKAILDDKISSYAILTIAVAFGILTKSPVILAHLLPLYLFAPLWAPKRVEKSFYIKGLLAVVLGVALALIWAIPASIEGGASYAKGILWEQYAGRVVDAFAHKRPFWWYIPWIPIVMMPWILYRGFWVGVVRVFKERLDKGIEFLLIWLGGVLIIFSLISGKQLHYIAPDFLAFALFIARALSLSREKLTKPYLFATIYLLFGFILILAPLFIKGKLLPYLDMKAFIISGGVLIFYAGYLFIKRFNSQKEIIHTLSIGGVLLIFAVHYSINLYLKSQDLTRFSKIIDNLQKSGVVVGHLGKYHDQFHFYGRLHKPLKIIDDSKEKKSKELREFIKNYPNGVIVTYSKRGLKYNKDVIFASTKFRLKDVVLVKAKDWNRLVVK